eukprot:13883923-Ditylum_brightwellii.AAC.1
MDVPITATVCDDKEEEDKLDDGPFITTFDKEEDEDNDNDHIQNGFTLSDNEMDDPQLQTEEPPTMESKPTRDKEELGQVFIEEEQQVKTENNENIQDEEKDHF